MSAMYASLRLITAVVICLLIVHRSKVAAQSPPPTMTNACYAVCEASFSALLKNISSPRAFIAKFENSTQKAADYYCSTIANISACFSACSKAYTTFIYPDRLFILGTLKSEQFKCFTDDAKCRAKDSQLFCNSYFYISCGVNTARREECISGVQAQRGCNLTSPTHQSQRAVLAIRLDDYLYCLNDFDTILIEQFEGEQIQICVEYIPNVCLSAFIDERTGRFDSYYVGNASCSDVQTARDCVQASLTSTINYDGSVYPAPCQYHPHGASLFAKLDDILSTLLPCSQQASASTSTVTAITTVAMPSTSAISAIAIINVSAANTREAPMASQTNAVCPTASTCTPFNKLKNSFWFSAWSSASTYPRNTVTMMHCVAVTVSLYLWKI